MLTAYNVSYRNVNGAKQRAIIVAQSLNDAKGLFNDSVRVDGTTYFDCKLLRIWEKKESTHKQKLAQKYGFILGCIKAAKIQFHNAEFPLSQITWDRLGRAQLLADSQFARLERDIRDCFKLAGLKVK